MSSRVRRVLSMFLLLAGVPITALLTGCGAGLPEESSSGTLALQGTVHGGQQGVAGATIHLYRAGTTGNGAASLDLLMNPVTTDKFGFFGITGDYTCPSASDQVYIVATGGNPGNGVNNPAIAMMAALGNCGTLLAQGSSRFLFINEVTTVAAAWTLAPFMTGPSNLGRSATNAQGLQNAFLNAALLADTTSGNVATNSYGLTIESGKLLALADALAPCINSTGTQGCSSLFLAATPSGGATPTDTITAALNIVKHPGTNVAAVWNTIGSTPPFPTTLTAAPNDWTMSITVPLAPGPGGSVAAPENLDVDASGTVWVAGFNGILNAVTSQGVLLNSAGFGAGALRESYGVAVDTSGYVWVTNEQSSPNAAGSVTKFQGSNMSSPGTIVAGNGGTNFYDSSLNFPYDIAADASGNVFLGNYANGSATKYSTATNAPTATYLGYGYGSYVQVVAPDGAGGVWLADSSSSYVTHALASGTASNTTACCSDSDGVATDPAGNVWVANYDSSSVSALSYAGTVLLPQASVGGISYPARLSVDAGGTVWVANYYGSTSHGPGFSGVSSGTVSGEPAIGTAISPANGFGLDAHLSQPYAIVPDRSGDLWVSNHGYNNLVMFVGLATPTSTPTMPKPTAP